MYTRVCLSYDIVSKSEALDSKAADTAGMDVRNEYHHWHERKWMANENLVEIFLLVETGSWAHLSISEK